jgi:ribosomal-protein-alanine N-acetyltransferase
VSNDAVVREATLEDIAAILEIESGCAEAPHWSEADWAQVFASHQLPGPQRRCLVAASTVAVVGFVVVSVVADVAEMESLAVRGDARRQGIGRSLCLQAVLWAQSRGAATMQLEVRTRSVAARALYESLGFMQQGVRQAYYKSPVDDAVLMELRPGHRKL